MAHKSPITFAVVSSANGWVVTERNPCLSKRWIPAKPALRAFCESRRPVFAEKLKHRATRNRASKIRIRRGDSHLPIISQTWPFAEPVKSKSCGQDHPRFGFGAQMHSEALESQGCGTRPTLSEGHSPLSPQNCFPFSRPLTIDRSYMWPRHSRQHGTFRLHLPAGSFSWTDF